jgi:hypothetical protein
MTTRRGDSRVIEIDEFVTAWTDAERSGDRGSPGST